MKPNVPDLERPWVRAPRLPYKAISSVRHHLSPLRASSRSVCEDSRIKDSPRVRESSREFATSLRRVRESSRPIRKFARIREDSRGFARSSRASSQGFAVSSRRIRKFANRVREDSRPVNVGSPPYICVGSWLGQYSRL